MRGLLIFAVIWTLLITLWMFSKRIVEDKDQAYTDGAAMAVMEFQKSKTLKVTGGIMACDNAIWDGLGTLCTLFCCLKSETLIIVSDSILDRRPIKKAEIFIDPNHGGVGRLYDNINKRYLDGLK